MSVPDYALGTTINFCFTTRRFSTGVPYTLAGTPALSVKESGNDTVITSGITLDVDTCATPVTGLNEVEVVATSGNGYEAGKSYSVYISAGTVDSVSVVGEVIYQFTIEKQSALRPTVAGRTLDVSAGGEAGLDWANMGSPTTVVGLTGTTIKTATDVETDTADIQTRLPAALVAGRMDASVGAMATDVITNTALATSAVDEIVDAVWDEATSGHTTAGTTGKALTDAGSAGDPWSTSLPGAYGAGTAGYIVGTNLDATVSGCAVAGDAMTLTSGERNSVADALLDRNMATGTDSGSPTVRTVRQSLRFLRNKWTVSAGTLTVYKEDDATSSWTGTVSTDAAADPVTGNDPA